MSEKLWTPTDAIDCDIKECNNEVGWLYLDYDKTIIEALCEKHFEKRVENELEFTANIKKEAKA